MLQAAFSLRKHILVGADYDLLPPRLAEGGHLEVGEGPDLVRAESSIITFVTRWRVRGSGFDASDPPLATRNTLASSPIRPTI